MGKTVSPNYRFLERVFNSLFDYEDMPDTIDIDFMNWYLNRPGYITFLKAGDGTHRVLQGAISGLDCYNAATDFESANPVGKYSGLKRKIGKNCVVIYNTRNKRTHPGNKVLFTKYADMLDLVDKAINASLFNSMASTIYNVDDDAVANKIRLMVSQIADGQPFILTTTKAGMAMHIAAGGRPPIVEHIPVKQNYIVDMLLRDRYTILCNFLTEIGINSTPFEKKERQIESEVESNNELLHITNFEYLEARQEAFDKINEMFGLNIKVKFNAEVVKEVLANGNLGTGIQTTEDGNAAGSDQG